MDLPWNTSQKDVSDPSRKKEPEPCCTEEKRWYESPLLWIGVATAGIATSGIFIPLLKSLSVAYGRYLEIVWMPLLLGLIVGGLIDRFVPKRYISKILRPGQKKTVVTSVLLGFLASACSHGVLALAMELHKKGASGPAVVSFLLASPWESLPITVLLIGFFGLKGFAIILGAMIVATLTGLLFLELEKKGWIESRPAIPEKDFSILQDIGSRMRNYRFGLARLEADLAAVLRGMGELAQMILGWILIGLFLASLADAFVPPWLFQQFMGPSILGLAVTLLAATVIEICSEGSSPVSFEIFKQTGALGNSFVFLTAGVITDYTELGAIWSHIGKKTALWLVAVSVPQVLVIGYLLNLLR